ncbi:MAG: hypothetical protein DME60_03885 [Verrucomicrobia bacterium]|nr:MAG: hypothetical protein DME60_03885 [Verrucomicrobiota bacterium]
MESRMKTLARTSLFGAVLLVGCGTTRDVAVTSYHVTRDVAVGSYRVATAPVHYALRRNRDDASTAEVTSTETIESDVTEPGRPVESEVASTRQQQPRIESDRVSTPSSTAAPRVARKETTQSKTKSSSSSHASSGPEFPTAKLVPGKPGYVVSPFDSSGRYVDITGYTSGSKVKDPWTNKIFIVP